MAPALRAYVPDLARGTVPGNRYGVSGHVMKLVLIGLADAAGEDGTGARPGIRSLALHAQCTLDTAGMALRGLEHLGAIMRTDRSGPGRNARWTINLAWLAAQCLACNIAGDPRGLCPWHRMMGPTRDERAGRPATSARVDPRENVNPSRTSWRAFHDDDTADLAVPDDVLRKFPKLRGHIDPPEDDAL